MKKLYQYLTQPLLIAALLAGGGLANLSMAIILISLSVCTVLFLYAFSVGVREEPPEAKVSKFGKWWGASMFITYVAIVAYQGHVFIAVIMAVMAICSLFAYLVVFSKDNCKHERYQENMSCHGICLSCGDDLGFIGTLREKNPRGETGLQTRNVTTGRANVV